MVKTLLPYAVIAIILILAVASTAVFLSGCGIATKRVELPAEELELEGEKYILTFMDDFDGEKLDGTKWKRCPTWNRGDVGGRWDDSMTYLDGKGNLVVSATIDEEGTPISGGVRTLGRFEQCRGYFEIRCKLQNAVGFWGAFWLMCDGEKSIGNGAVDGAEIDIFESYSTSEGAINHAVHWDGYGEAHRSIARQAYDKALYDGEYHTFSLLWNSDAYVFYIDGKESCRMNAETEKDYPGSCEVPVYLKISTEFGTWGGKYDKATLPDGLIVDYVKVYGEKK